MEVWDIAEIWSELADGGVLLPLLLKPRLLPDRFMACVSAPGRDVAEAAPSLRVDSALTGNLSLEDEDDDAADIALLVSRHRRAKAPALSQPV